MSAGTLKPRPILPRDPAPLFSRMATLPMLRRGKLRLDVDAPQTLLLWFAQGPIRNAHLQEASDDR